MYQNLVEDLDGLGSDAVFARTVEVIRNPMISQTRIELRARSIAGIHSYRYNEITPSVALTSEKRFPASVNRLNFNHRHLESRIT
jgi:hypothetical protein